MSALQSPTTTFLQVWAKFFSCKDKMSKLPILSVWSFSEIQSGKCVNRCSLWVKLTGDKKAEYWSLIFNLIKNSVTLRGWLGCSNQAATIDLF
jgi:hypothetical protein